MYILLYRCLFMIILGLRIECNETLIWFIHWQKYFGGLVSKTFPGFDARNYWYIIEYSGISI